MRWNSADFHHFIMCKQFVFSMIGFWVFSHDWVFFARWNFPTFTWSLGANPLAKCNLPCKVDSLFAFGKSSPMCSCPFIVPFYEDWDTPILLLLAKFAGLPIYCKNTTCTQPNQDKTFNTKGISSFFRQYYSQLYNLSSENSPDDMQTYITETALLKIYPQDSMDLDKTLVEP